jgi:hypothetical protein
MPERWERFQKSFAASKLLGHLPVTRWRATPMNEMLVPDYWPHWKTYYGTREDWLTMIERAYLDGVEHVLIFEDDAQLKKSFDPVYEAACNDLPESWRGLWLGGHLTDHRLLNKQITPHLYRLGGCLSTHAVLLNRKGMLRVFSHTLHQIKTIMDWATRELHQMEPHFYTTPHEIVSADGIRTS